MSYVTRTTKFTEGNILVANKVTAEMENRPFSCPKVFKKDKSLEEAIQNDLTAEDPALKLVDIVDKKVSEKLLGMDDDYFNAHAVELDPATRKPLAVKEA